MWHLSGLKNIEMAAGSGFLVFPFLIFGIAQVELRNAAVMFGHIPLRATSIGRISAASPIGNSSDELGQDTPGLCTGPYGKGSVPKIPNHGWLFQVRVLLILYYYPDI